MARRLALLLLLLSVILPAEARWVRIAIERTGLYVLTESQLRAWGFVDPKRVGVYGTGGAMLPEDLSLLRERRLSQTPIYIAGDKRYFFAQGTTRWVYLPEKDFFSHETNPYTRTAYYLLSDEAEPEVMQDVRLATSTSSPSHESSTYTACYLHEEDTYTPSNTGRHLFGEDLTRTPQLTLSLPQDLQATALRVRLAYMAYPQAEDARLSLSLGGKHLLQSTLSLEEMRERMPAGGYHVYGRRKVTDPSALTPLMSREAPQLTLSYETPKILARLDYLEANLTAPLTYSGKGQLLFSRGSSAGKGQSFHLTAPAGTQIFRVDEAQATQHLTDKGTFTTAPSPTPPLFLALQLSEAYSPTFVREEEAPHLLQEPPAVDLFIITTEALRLEAERLASYYRGIGKDVLVATQQQLFNELNGGTPDASVYRLACYLLYQRARSAGKGEDFQLLLFGDGAHDNRRLSLAWQSSELQSTELLLTYQSRNSLDLDSYTSDDYFAMLSPEEDRSIAVDSDDDHLVNLSMTIGVGRFPVRTAQEARALVDKTIRYAKGEDLGLWRTRATFVADNGDSNRHLRQSLAVSRALSEVAPQLFIRPVYLADYPRKSSGGKVTVPGAERALRQALSEGTLLLTYTGHGGPRSWTDEQLLTTADVRRFAHRHLPLWLTATCDFAPFDAPTTSAGEEVVLHPTSGGIALLGTTRIAWDLPNQAMATAVLQALFTPDASGKLRPLGSAIREAKNKLRKQAYPINRLNFTLLGSPLLQLPYPAVSTALTQLGDKSLSAHSQLTLTPGGQLNLEGELRDSSGKRDASFQGRTRIRLYDSPQRQETIDNFNYGDTNIPPVSYSTYKDLLVDEEVSVEAGRYHLSTSLPYEVRGDKHSLRLEVYATDPTTKRDAYGVFTEIYWGADSGADPQTPKEPIRIESFSLGGKRELPELGSVASSSLLQAVIHAPHGINRSEQSLGHLPRLTFDEQEGLTFDLREYLQPIEGKPKSYRLSFPLPPLTEGGHQLRLRLWDLAGQLTELTASFTLLSGLHPEITSARIYPSETSPASPLTLEITSPASTDARTLEGECFDLQGQLRAQLPPLARSFASGKETFDLTTWTALLAPGSYLLRVRLRSGEGASDYQVVRFLLRL